MTHSAPSPPAPAACPFRCTVRSVPYQGNCEQEIGCWLSLLAAEGGPLGRALVNAVHQAAQRNRWAKRLGCATVAKLWQLYVVEPATFGHEGVVAQGGHGAIFLSWHALAAFPSATRDEQYALVGALAHEIQHLRQGVRHACLRTEAEAYYVQAQVYQAFGYHPPHNNPAFDSYPSLIQTALRWEPLHHASDYALLTASLTQHYRREDPSFPLYRTLYLTDLMEWLARRERR